MIKKLSVLKVICSSTVLGVLFFMSACSSTSSQGEEVETKEVSLQQTIGLLGLQTDNMSSEMKEVMQQAQKLIVQNLEVDTIKGTINFRATEEDFKKAGFAADVYQELAKNIMDAEDYISTLPDKKEALRSLCDAIELWKERNN